MLDQQLSQSMDFTYNVIDSFDDNGNKVPQILSHNAIFIDCGYLNKDIYSIVYDLALILKEHNYGLFVLARKRLNELLVGIRDDMSACEYVPEIDIILKNQMEIYMKPFDESSAELTMIQNQLDIILSKNLDGSPNETIFNKDLPTLVYVEQNDYFKQMMRAVNANLIINIVLLSIIVVYSLMLSDVNEQTYQFAMMRALGFKKDHVLVFVVLQAFSFAIPGMLLGLLISLVLNEGFREVMFITMKNASDYGLPTSAVLAAILLFGFIVPIISIIGPTQEALGKNLRASLDASRRNGEGEGVSVTVQKLQDWAMSRREIFLGIFLVTFGFVTYYIIPLSLLFSNWGLFFFIMNAILTSLTIASITLAVLIMQTVQ